MLEHATEHQGIVLHVEDDRVLGESMAMLLNTSGYRTLTATDGPSALAWVTEQKLRPDVLIIDANLESDMDGADVAEAVCRALGQVVPTILLSGQLSNASMPWLPGAPIFPVWKPADPDILLRVVETFAVLGQFIRQHARRVQV